MKIDATVSNEVLRIIKPLGIDAAVKAIEAQSTVRYLGIEVDDAIEIAEKIDI